MQELEFPQSSVATHVLVIVCASGQFPPEVTSEKVIVGVPSQLSVAVAVPVEPGAVLSLQLIVTFAGQVMAGAVLSSTNIVCVQVLIFPQSSVAFHVLVMVNSCGQVPPAVTSVKVMVGEVSQKSVAVAVPVFAGKVLALH